MTERVYEKLRELLDCHPLPFPDAPEAVEILKILFTEDEVGVALGLSFRPLKVPEIAFKAGVEPQETKKRLEAMADKGVVVAREKGGVWSYALQASFGILESAYWKGIPNKTTDKLTPLIKKYHEAGVASAVSSDPPFVRVIPIQEQIEHNPEILTYEKIYEMIDKADVVGVAHCHCRGMQQNCDAPRETCMGFNEFATFWAQRGLGRYLTKEEMKQKLREFDEAGLVHQAINAQDELGVICNCCPCCCPFLRGFNEFGNPRILAKSGFIPVTDQDQCVGSGTCAEERCPTKARVMVDERPVFNQERCIGCGLCVTGCKNEAIHLERNADVPEPPANSIEWGTRVLQDQGKLEAFMEVMKPVDIPPNKK